MPDSGRGTSAGVLPTMMSSMSTSAPGGSVRSVTRWGCTGAGTGSAAGSLGRDLGLGLRRLLGRLGGDGRGGRRRRVVLGRLGRRLPGVVTGGHEDGRGHTHPHDEQRRAGREDQEEVVPAGARRRDRFLGPSGEHVGHVGRRRDRVARRRRPTAARGDRVEVRRPARSSTGSGARGSSRARGG